MKPLTPGEQAIENYIQVLLKQGKTREMILAAFKKANERLSKLPDRRKA